MPIYEYRCPDCGEKFEKLVRLDGTVEVICPRCQSTHPQRLISIVARSSRDAGGSYSAGAASGSCGTTT